MSGLSKLLIGLVLAVVTLQGSLSEARNPLFPNMKRMIHPCMRTVIGDVNETYGTDLPSRAMTNEVLQCYRSNPSFLAGRDVICGPALIGVSRTYATYQTALDQAVYIENYYAQAWEAVTNDPKYANNPAIVLDNSAWRDAEDAAMDAAVAAIPGGSAAIAAVGVAYDQLLEARKVCEPNSDFSILDLL